MQSISKTIHGQSAIQSYSRSLQSISSFGQKTNAGMNTSYFRETLHARDSCWPSNGSDSQLLSSMVLCPCHYESPKHGTNIFIGSWYCGDRDSPCIKIRETWNRKAKNLKKPTSPETNQSETCLIEYPPPHNNLKSDTWSSVYDSSWKWWSVYLCT